MLKEWVRVYGPALLIAIAALVVAWQFVAPAPPNRVVMATGPEGGAYDLFGQRYKAELARHRITVELRRTAGSVENLRLLQDPGSGVDIALLQGGIMPNDDSAKIRALASVFVEPVWLFTRLEPAPDALSALRGKRLAIGPEGSGTRLLMTRALALNGLDEGNTTLLPLAGDAAVDALVDGSVDVLATVASVRSPVVQRLIALDGVRLMSLRRAKSYEQRFRFVRALPLYEGVLDFARNVPEHDTLMVAPIAALVARRDDFHPALVDLFLEAALEIHGGGDLLSPPRTFPIATHPEIPTIQGARRYLDQGPGLLRRYLPFWAATWLERSMVVLIPLLTLLLPFLRILPPAIDWRIRSRAFRWYRELREIEHDATHATGQPREALRARLDALEARLRDLKMPLSRNNLVYDLRQHLELVRNKLDAPRPDERSAA